MRESVQRDDGKAVQVKFDRNLLAKIERWRGQQAPLIPSRPSAVRTLVEQSLADTTSAVQVKP